MRGLKCNHILYKNVDNVRIEFMVNFLLLGTQIILEHSNKKTVQVIMGWWEFFAFHKFCVPRTIGFYNMDVVGKII